MDALQSLPIAATAVVLLALLALYRSIRSRRRWKLREFERRLDTVLLSREKIKVVCPQRSGNCVLTSKRLLIQTGDGFTAIPFARIKKVQGTDAGGKTTASVAKMTGMNVIAEKEYRIRNTDPSFEELAKQLKAAVAKAKSKGKKK